MSEKTDIEWMHDALDMARKAAHAGEVPVGAVLVKDGQCIATGVNAMIQTHDPTAHAEMNAMRSAGKTLQNYRLLDTTLYVTLEPCAMCATAMVHARIKRLVFGAFDPKTGAAGSVTNAFVGSGVNHTVEVTSGVLAEECSQMLSDFFRARRVQKKQEKKV